MTKEATSTTTRARTGVGFCLLVAIACALCATPVRAQSSPERWVLEFGPYSGYYDFDALTEFENFAVFGLRLGARMNTWLCMEGAFDEVYTNREVTGSKARQVSFVLHARIDPLRTRVAPYALVGTAFVILDDSDDPDAFGQAYDFGLGVRWNVGKRWMLRTEWVLRRQDFDLWRSVDDGLGGRVLESEAVTLWSRSPRLGLSYVF